MIPQNWLSRITTPYPKSKKLLAVQRFFTNECLQKPILFCRAGPNLWFESKVSKDLYKWFIQRVFHICTDSPNCPRNWINTKIVVRLSVCLSVILSVAPSVKTFFAGMGWGVKLKLMLPINLCGSLNLWWIQSF